jgi:hypothetical protein
VLWGRAHCHGAGSTCQGKILASHNETIVSDIPELEIKFLVDNTSRWEELSVHYLFSIKETNQQCLNFCF